MQITDFLALLGGLSLFLYGMQMMSSGLEAAAGEKLQKLLERLTTNRFLGVLVGAGITMLIQSSSATTVMTVGFVNSGMMTLNQAVWIIMGANIGTTVTAQLITMDISMLAPLLAFVGVTMVVFFKKKQVNHVGQILAGLGILFIGMDMMSSAMSPLRESPVFAQMFAHFTNPLLGILAGALVTMIIQSSSASVGILQALAASGAITLSSAVYVLFGQNIGTCITAVLASIGTSRNAKRTTLIHLMFNIFGTVLFTVICILTPLTALVSGFTPDAPASQIANMHTLFNIVTTLLLLPVGNLMAKAAVAILPDRAEDKEDTVHLEYLTDIKSVKSENRLGQSAIYVGQVRQELNRMLLMAKENTQEAFRVVMERDAAAVPQIEQREEYLDYLNKEISQYISKALSRETNAQAAETISSYFTIVGNIERIGDHAMNVGGYSAMLAKKDIQFSEAAQQELVEMRDLTLEGIDTLLETGERTPEWLARVAALEERSDEMTDRFRASHLARMRAGKCSEEACIIYSELLTDFERLGDHMLNIGEELEKISAQN